MRRACLLVVLVFAACGDDNGARTAPPDAAPPESSGDAGPADSGAGDAGPADAGPIDAGPVDAGPIDSGPVDAGSIDAGPTDSGPIDSGPTDSGPTDSGPIDSGPPAVRFAALGDTGKANQGQFDVAAAIQQKCAADGCDFALLLGDNLYDDGAGSPTDALFGTLFEVPYADVALPFWVVLGNHDYGGNGAGTGGLAKGQYEVDYTQHSTKWKMPSRYYTHAHGQVEFFALDTNQAFIPLFSTDGVQKNDMIAAITASSALWKIAVGHHPYKSNGPHGNAGIYDGVPFLGANFKGFLDDVVCGKVDLYLCGHDHSRQWLEDTCDGTELAISGAGATATTLSSRNATRFESTELGFLYVVIQGRTLTAEFVDTSGAVNFTRTLTK